MRVCVAGLWHLGTVTAAALASVGHDVAAHDTDSAVVEDLSRGIPPLFEPGLKELIADGLESDSLHPIADAAEAVRGAELVWVAYDTPVDADDNANVDYVLDRVRALLPLLDHGTVVLISSQLPVGSTALLQADAPPGISLAYSPENLRLGKALNVFLEPDRVVVGVRDPYSEKVIAELLEPITDQIAWMGVESAEMTKHALNAFLATSVTFINEVASVCERVGADAGEVSSALKSEARIGPRAYLGPGGAFAGGTLARDIRSLTTIGDAEGLLTPLLHGVWDSNIAHRGWTRRTINILLGNGTSATPPDGLAGKTIAVWGLTYKPGTDTLRRSASVELCADLLGSGATVRAHDPAVQALPGDVCGATLMDDPFAAADGADALVIATEWPAYRELDAAKIPDVLRGDLVVDANGFLAQSLARDPRIRYASVGRRPA
jgi:UDPglucose 6-dehydrogenase